MKKQEAEEILAPFIDEDGELFEESDRGDESRPCINSSGWNGLIALNGEFDADELEAMAWWLRNKLKR